jgi:hypothetical protein
MCKTSCLHQQIPSTVTRQQWPKGSNPDASRLRSFSFRAIRGQKPSDTRPGPLGGVSQRAKSNVRQTLISASSKAPTIPEVPATQQQTAITKGDGQKPPPDTRWYTVVGLSALAALICSVDRAAISVAILPMSEQFHWSDSTKGAVNRWATCRQQVLVQDCRHMILEVCCCHNRAASLAFASSTLC